MYLLFNLNIITFIQMYLLFNLLFNLNILPFIKNDKQNSNVINVISINYNKYNSINIKKYNSINIKEYNSINNDKHDTIKFNNNIYIF